MQIDTSFPQVPTSMTLNILELSRGFSELFAILGCGTHFKSELRRNYWRWSKRICVWN